MAASQEGDFEAPRWDSGGDGWELFEVVPALIVAGVGLIFVGSVAYQLMVLSTPFGGGAIGDWTLIASTLRWAGLTTSFMLVSAAALVWWQYDKLIDRDDQESSDAVVYVHVARLRLIAKWMMAASVVVLASVVGEIVSSIVAGALGPSDLPDWALPVFSILSAVAAGTLAGVGVVILRRILSASHGEPSLADPS